MYTKIVMFAIRQFAFTFQFAKFNVHQIYRGYGISELVSIMTCKSFLPEWRLADDPLYSPTLLPSHNLLHCVVSTYLATSL